MIICNKKIKNCVFDNEHTHWRYSLHNLIVYRDLIVYTTAHLVLLQSDCVVEQFTSCQNNEGWEDGSCDEIRPEMDKSFNQGGFWLTQMCQMIWCSRKAPKDWQTGVILPMDRKETERNATTTEAFLSLAFLEKAFGKYFEKDAAKRLRKSWRINTAVLVVGVVCVSSRTILGDSGTIRGCRKLWGISRRGPASPALLPRGKAGVKFSEKILLLYDLLT